MKAGGLHEFKVRSVIWGLEYYIKARMIKPYKIITSEKPIKKKKVIGPMRIPKIPLTFFSLVHTPPKSELGLPTT
jgi:hypothetical protein